MVILRGNNIMAETMTTTRNSIKKTITAHDQFLKPTIKRKILIIDDNKDLVHILEIALKVWGHDVRVAHYGLLGIEIAHTFVPDIVILDIGMPGMDGYAACKVMSKDPKLKDTLFIAQTGWGSLEHRRLSKQAGFHYHLVKPFNLDSLQHLLENKEQYMKPY